MKDRESCCCGKLLQARATLQVRFYVFAHALQRAGRQAPARVECTVLVLINNMILNGTRRGSYQYIRKGMRPVGERCIKGGHIQYGDHSTIGIQDWCARATETNVPGTEVLSVMNRDRALLGETCANGIGPLNIFRPHPTKINSGIPELGNVRRIGTTVDRHSFTVAQENDVPCLPHNLMEAV